VSLRVIRGWRDVDPQDRGASIAFGAFDGIHRGHQVVIAAAGDAGRRLGAPLGVVRFDPHPWRWFNPDEEDFLLTTPHQTERLLERMGVQKLYYIPFNAETALMPAEDFVRDVLVGAWDVKHVTAGFDIFFGRAREGDADTLKQLGRQYGFGVTIVEPLTTASGQKYSSSQARAAVAEGDMATAARILGRSFAIEGEVVRGEGLGDGLGFPTANVSIAGYQQPRLGVYAVRSRLPDGRVVDGVASVGTNPTTGLVEPRLEVWLFDFRGDLYGQRIETELLQFIRPEERFESIEALKTQVADDARRAREILAATP
jgi:riboflavin kinase/FMN adenylyltransferase